MILKNMDAPEFLARIDDGRRLVCVGAGKQLSDICKLLYEYNFFEKISVVLDNFSQTFTCPYGTKMAETPDDYVKRTSLITNSVFLITSADYPDLFEQLHAMPELNKVECYIWEYIRKAPPAYTLLVGDEPKIPKKIHYIWFGGNEMSEKHKRCIDSWRKYCPDFEIIRWDESNYDPVKQSYMAAAYKEKKYAFASDYARLDIIFNEGGIYLDTDVELLRNIEPLLYNDCFFG
ncbi:MAG: hypothetical protein LBB94_04255 [Clostridiales bacterium]|jgi:mannosyltransferase OCH1-like enzyme|nr:hypothetical protein [Clostridiales bacterium]